MMQNDLVLRDIHLPPAPSWWPPAPGWWWLAAALAILALAGCWLTVRRRNRRVALARLFDDTVAAARTPSEQVARISELLRRAAIRRDPTAGQWQGDAWMQRLDTDALSPSFDANVARTLHEGGYRTDTTQAEADTLRTVARLRFMACMSGRR